MIQVTSMLPSQQGRRNRNIAAFQFGTHLLPRVQSSHELSWKFRETTSDTAFLVDGAVDSAAVKLRAPLGLGELTWSGKYECITNNNRVTGCMGDSEHAGILAGAGTWKQLMIFVDDTTTCPDCEDCGFIDDSPDGQWMWTWAKIEEPRLKGDTDGIIKGTEAAEFKFTLRSPFMEVDKAHWRFGTQPKIYQARTYYEAEQLINSGNTRKPKRLPPCDDSSRWHWRDPFSCVDTSCTCYYELDCMWGTRNYQFRGKGSAGINVPGTFEASGYLRAKVDNTLIRIINDTYFVQEVSLMKGETMDLDRQEIYSKCTPRNPLITKFPRITPGINRIEYVGDALVAIKPRWLL